MRSNLFRLKQRPGRRLAAYRPTLELLEDRRVPAVLTQTGVILPHRPTAPGLTLALATASDADGDGIVQQADVTVVGRSVQRARVRLDADGDSAFDQQTRADKKGRFKFDVVVANGVTPLRVLAASDGRKWTAELLVTGRFSHSALPDTPQNVAWHFDQLTDAAKVEVMVRAIAPGSVFAPGGNYDVSPGSRPATGETFYLRSDNTWSPDPVVYGVGQAAGHLTVDLPNGDEGLWRLEVLATHGPSGAFEAGLGTNVLVSSVPAVHLKVNRTLANRLDPIVAELITSGGQSPQDVLLLASLELPDGSQVSLPSFRQSLDYLHQGPSSDGYYALLGQSLDAFGEGDYHLRVRLIDAATSRFLAMADAQIHVADAPGNVSGVVHDNTGQPVDGTLATVATVKAFDVDDGAVAGQAPIGADGTYSLTLLPGRYVTSVFIMDAQGQAYRTELAGLTVIGPAGADVSLDFTVGGLEASALNTNQPFVAKVANIEPLREFLADADPFNGLPPPSVGIVRDFTISAARAELLANSLERFAPEGNFTAQADFARNLQAYAQDQMLGGAGDAQGYQALLDSAKGFEFAILIRVVRSSIQTVKLQLVKPNTGLLILAAEHTVQHVGDGVLNEQIDLAALKLVKAGLLGKLAAERDLPLSPTTRLSLQNERLEQAGVVRANVVVQDANGQPVADGLVVFTHRPPGGEATSQQARTDRSGAVQMSFPAGTAGGIGIVSAYLKRADGAVFSSYPRNVEYEVGNRTTDAGIELSSRRREMQAGESAPVFLTLAGPGATFVPIKDALVRLSVANVTATALETAARLAGPGLTFTDAFGQEATGTTDKKGQLNFVLVSGTTQGRAIVTATYELRSSDPNFPPQTLSKSMEFVFVGDAALNVRLASGEDSLGAMTLRMANVLATDEPPLVSGGGAASLLADLIIGGGRVPNQPVAFTLQGPGELEVFTTQTDPFGLADTIYRPPAEGSGVATITATATVDGETVVESLTVRYAPSEAAIIDLGTFNGRPITPTAVNASGQVVGYFNPPGGDIHAFLYRDGRMTDFGTLGGLQTFPHSINSAGQVVGTSDIASGDFRAFLYSNGVMTDLGSLGGRFSRGRDVNDAGQIVGESLAPNGYFYAFLYSDGQMKSLGTLGNAWSEAYAINASGQVAGDYISTDGSRRAFLYSNGQMTDIGTLGGVHTRPVDINDVGQIIGHSGTADSQLHPFLYSGGQMTDLTTLGFSSVTSINNAGHLLGESGTGLGAKIVLYRDGRMIDLNTLLPANSGWVISPANSEAVAMNNAGQVVGRGIHNGASRAFLLTLP